MNFTIQKSFFRNDPRFGRTTILLSNGKPVLEVMGVVGIKALIKQHQSEPTFAQDLKR